MTYEELSQLAMDTQTFICYIIDFETYELLYVNKAAKEAFALTGNENYLGRHCYELFQLRNSPCEKCNQCELEYGKNTQRDMPIALTGGNYSFIDTLVDVDGRKARFTIAINTTEHYQHVNFLAKKLTREETFIRCIQTLTGEVSTEEAIVSLLKIIGEYHQAERAFLFEINDKTHTAKNAYEWVLHDEAITFDIYPHMEEAELKYLLDAFEKDGECFLNIATVDKKSSIYKVLELTKTKIAMISPLYTNGELTAFIGVDNPNRMLDDFSLLHSVAIFVNDDLKKRRFVEELEELSYVDTLTGLNNRNKYMSCLRDIDKRKIHSVGIVHINVDGLKKINDIYGQQHGDFVLQQVASLLKSMLPNELFRLSGDEFIALCFDISNVDFENLIKSLRKESENSNDFSFSVGGLWQDEKIDIVKGVAQASELMFAEKQKYYKKSHLESVKVRSNSVEIILNEIAAEYFSVHYQPKVELTTSKIVGLEALIRKVDGDGNIIPPDKFVPIYEHDGTIRHIDFYVLESVCLLLQTLMSLGKPLKIAVNFSRVTFMSYDLVDEITKIADKYRIPHEYIKIEITESIDKMDFAFFAKKLKAIKEQGFDISLDDFGAMHSNLLMLAMAEFSEVKIDKRLIDNINTNIQNSIVVRNIIKTIKEIGTSICVAEGIETKKQRDLLAEFGCEHGQGYYFYKPMKLEDFLKIY